MTKERNKIPYQERLDTWNIEKDADCANYQRAKAWAIENGFVLKDDVSYNGFIQIRKIICESEDPHDGNRLDIKVYSNAAMDEEGRDRHHVIDQFDMEIDFENDSIFKPLKYRYKAVHGQDVSKSSRDLEVVLAFTLEREATLKAEYAKFLEEHPTTEWKMTDPDNFQYGRLVRGTPEFKEFDRGQLPELYNKMKAASQEKLDAYLKENFENEFLWIKSKILLSRYTEEQIDDNISAYYKDLDEVKEIYGKDWEFIVAECIFEQESGLY